MLKISLYLDGIYAVLRILPFLFLGSATRVGAKVYIIRVDSKGMV